NWPVVGILRQNVMALIVPAPPASKPAAPATAKPEKAEKSAEKSAKSTKGKAKSGKTAKAAKGKGAKTKTATNDDSDSSDDSDDSSDSSDSNSLKVSDLAGKRIGIVTGNEATKALLGMVLSHYGVPINKVTLTEIDPANVAAAVSGNQVD